MIGFEWDSEKSKNNLLKHGIDFSTASRAFFDEKTVYATDAKHSDKEERFFCFGKVDGEIVTARFTMRGNKIRIIGAGYWRKGKEIYEQKENQL